MQGAYLKTLSWSRTH